MFAYKHLALNSCNDLNSTAAALAKYYFKLLEKFMPQKSKSATWWKYIKLNSRV